MGIRIGLNISIGWTHIGLSLLVAPLGRGVGGQLISDAYLDVPLDALQYLLLPVQGAPVGDGVTGWDGAWFDSQLEFWASHPW